MPIIGALSGVSVEEERRILDDIEHQFHLDEDALIRITQQFLKDMHLGLGEYNHPLAMMCVSPRIYARATGLTRCGQPYLCHWSPGRYGDWVSTSFCSPLVPFPRSRRGLRRVTAQASTVCSGLRRVCPSPLSPSILRRTRSTSATSAPRKATRSNYAPSLADRSLYLFRRIPCDALRTCALIDTRTRTESPSEARTRSRGLSRRM